MQGATVNHDRRETRRGAQGHSGGLNGRHSQHGNNHAQNKLKLSQNMLSQDSIKNYVDDANKESFEEQKRLSIQEQERMNFANKIIKGPGGNSHAMNGASGNNPQKFALMDMKNSSRKQFGKFTDGTNKQDRLTDLIERVEQYTRFILHQNLMHHKSQQRKKNKEVEVNGRDSKNHVSKRRQKNKGRARGNQDIAESSSDDENEGALTRLNIQPSILQGGDKLRDYQLDGLNWMISLYETGINGILADEMGLGKTIQTISFISFLREFKAIKGYHLIIMPKSVVGNWLSEFRKWCPDIKVCNLIARKEYREEIIKNELQPGKFDVCITTFEAIRICMSALSKFQWQYIIIDEAHKIKNEDSQTSKRIRQLKSKNRLLLTGTPLQNNLHELWSLLNFLLPEIFSSSDDFDEWFDLGSKANEGLTDQEKETKNNEVIKQLHKILRPFMLRRIKREVEKSLLPKIEMHIQVGITETQKSIYRQLLKKSTIEKGSSTSHYKNILVQLRKVCDHPYLFPGIEPDDAPELGDHLVKACGKMQFLDKLLKKARSDNSQTLIFSGFTTMLDILEDYCRFMEYPYCRLDGNTDLDDRQSQIDDFVSPDTNKFIFLISTRAGGLGLNLMTANTVVLYDSDWNPQMDLQAMDRAHRIGQKKQVRVYRLITKNTMEEKMVEKQTMKLKLDSLIIQKGRMAPKNTGLQKDDLKDMVNYGADAIFEIGSNIDDEDIDEMIKQGEEKAQKLDKEAQELMNDKFNTLNFDMNSCNLYQFEDVDFLKERRKDAEDALKKNVIQMMECETAENTRRKVKRNLAENSLSPNIFANGNVGVSNEALKKKLAKVTDYRFYPDPERLKELIEIEMKSKYNGYIQGVEQFNFTPEMKIEKDLIESRGFVDWERREYLKFLQALELFPTTDYVNISKHMESTKTPQEVEQYSIVFFEKVNTLHDSDKIKQRIEKAQKNVSFHMQAPYIIKNKVQQYTNPYDDMILTYATQKSKFFCKESDIILLCYTNQLGYGNWTKIKKAIKREQRCRYDHLFISRSEDELKKRVVYLVQSLEKEQEEMNLKRSKEQYNNISQEQKQEQEIPPFADLEAEILRLTNEAEEKTHKAFINLSLNQLQERKQDSNEVKNNNQRIDAFMKFNQNPITQNQQKQEQQKAQMQSQESKDTPMENSQSRNSQKNQSEDKMSNASGEFDREPEKEVQNQNKKSKGKKKTAKHDNQDSQDSIIRVGNNNNNTEMMIGEQEEEDEILERELQGLDDQGQGSPNGLSNMNKTTTENSKQDIKLVNPAAKKPATLQNHKPAGGFNGKNSASTKSTKQSNLADWVSSSNSNKAHQSSNLVGQKRQHTNVTLNDVEQRKKQITSQACITTTNKGVSEFNV